MKNVTIVAIDLNIRMAITNLKVEQTDSLVTSQIDAKFAGIATKMGLISKGRQL